MPKLNNILKQFPVCMVQYNILKMVRPIFFNPGYISFRIVNTHFAMCLYVCSILDFFERFIYICILYLSVSRSYTTK